MALTPGPEEAEFNNWYGTKFKPAMERGPLDKYVARHAWFAATAPLLERIAALTAQVEQAELPPGWMTVVVPKDIGPEPDWEDVRYQAETAIGIRLDSSVFSIVIREVRRWLAAQQAAQPVEGQSRFTGASWGRCTVEHVRMVQANPVEWPGYEVRMLYTSPPKAAPLTDEQQAILSFLGGSGPLDGLWFGDKHPTEQGAYWWRKRLWAAFGTPATVEKEGE